jgi:hypothetical protein
METGPADDVLRQALYVADEHFAQLELNSARMLIRDAFEALPYELQEAYWEVQDLYSERRLVQANRAWDDWMDKARGFGLI